ncbi:MAG: Flp family type IVb pilin [Nevskia sp.]|nr:Flp family type IVb pilin [Nevskia sp.]
MLKKIASFIRKEEGVTATEYALIIAVVAIVMLVGATKLGTGLSSVFTSISTAI